MSNVRLCASDALPQSIELNPNDTHYLRDVLRLAVGSCLEVGDPESGVLGLATIESVKDRVTVTISSWIPDLLLKQRPISVLCALCKGDKNELICDWSTELGCKEVHFWQSPRSVVRLKGADDCERKAARLTKIATAAAQQSKQAMPPKIGVHASLKAALEELTKQPGLVKLVCSLQPNSQALSGVCATLDSSAPVLLIIGPEGDLAPEEYELLLKDAQAIPVSLGPSVLRSELAVVSAVVGVRG